MPCTRTAVFGIIHDRWGQAVTALAALRPDASSDLTDEWLRSELKGVLAGYKVPKQITLVDAVPRQVNGKANYREARVMAEASSR